MGYRHVRQSTRLAHVRRSIAVEAARLMSEAGMRNYLAAKRKAALRLGITDEAQLPRNTEVEEALREHQRIFQAGTQGSHLRTLREAAFEALRFFERFRPRLVGAVLEGTADQHSAVCLHLFADTPEEVAIFLSDSGIPFEESERRFRIKREHWEFRPVFRFRADDVPLDLTVFPPTALRQAPLSQVDGRPMQRANLPAVESLLGEPDWPEDRAG